MIQEHQNIQHTDKIVENLIELVKNTAGSGKDTETKENFHIADRDAQEAYDTLQKLMWFGNNGELITKEIERGMEEIAELSRYDTEKELREAVEAQ